MTALFIICALLALGWLFLVVMLMKVVDMTQEALDEIRAEINDLKRGREGK